MFAVAVLAVSTAFAQQKKKITVEDVWARPTFASKFADDINFTSDGKFYTDISTTAKGNQCLLKYETASGKPMDTLINGNKTKMPDGKPLSFGSYVMSADEKVLLLQDETQPIYRRSAKAQYYLYDIGSRNIFKLSEKGAQINASLSPNGKKVAFTRDNDLWVVDIQTMNETRVTTDGKFNSIINGQSDWVYEEEFEFTQAYSWSADSKHIAYYKFDETNVPEYNMQTWGKLYPNDYRFKYPKAGENNSVVSIWVYNVENKQTKPVNIGNDAEQYIARMGFTRSPEILTLRRMNRLQNKLELIHANVLTGESKVVLTETSNQWIDINDDLYYLKDGKSFIFTSELKGYKHIYHYDINGKLIKQLTTGNWEVDNFLGVDEKSKTLYYTSTENGGSTERKLYSVSLDGKKKVLLNPEKGWHNITMAPDFSYYIDNYSAAGKPSVVTLFDNKGKVVKVLEDNKALVEKMAGYDIVPTEFFTFKNEEGVELSGWMLKPAKIDANAKLPVLMFVYGGPGNQQVKNAFGGRDYFWYQMLVQNGYMVVCVDGRGTGGKGNDFKKCTYAKLGELETKDQISTAKYLATLPNVDAARIGIWGWSFGGYMTSLCMTKGADFFKMGIAVAPVTNWRYYDSIYTERFLKTPQDNAAGYDQNSPVTFANMLKGKFLLVHGTGDDNVHFQNAVALQDALIKANKQFESFYYPNRNHGIYGGNTRLHLYTMMTKFIYKNL